MRIGILVVTLTIGVWVAIACSSNSKPTSSPTPGKSTTASPAVASSPSAATSTPAVSPTTIPTVAPKPTAPPLLEATKASLLTLADLPSDWEAEDADPGSAIADPSAFSACGPSAATSLDVGFSHASSSGNITGSPFLGEVVVVASSVAEATKSAADAAKHVTTCTTNDKVGSTTSITVTSQTLSKTYGDESSAYRVAMTSGSGDALGYVVIVRQSNLVATFFSLDIKGGVSLADLEAAVASGVARLK